MEWMIDTANLSDAASCMELYPIDGLTTNPSILKADLPFDYIERLRALRSLCGPTRSMHVQLWADTCEDMLRQADDLTERLGEGLHFKVPTTEQGVKTIGLLKKRGMRVTATAIYYQLQGLLAIAAGADYLAPYCNRMENNDIDFSRVIAGLRGVIDRDNMPSRILAASFKNTAQVCRAVSAGAHAVTVQPALLKAAMRSSLVLSAVGAFAADQAAVLSSDPA